jgi:hypothetical protein
MVKQAVILTIRRIGYCKQSSDTDGKAGSDTDSKRGNDTDSKQDNDTHNKQDNNINSSGTPCQISKSGQKPGASELSI